MATDKTEPPVGRIAVIGLLSIATVIGAQFVFRSYFLTMYESEAHRVVLDRPSELLQRKRTEDDEHLRTGRPMPIEQAMASIAHGALEERDLLFGSRIRRRRFGHGSGLVSRCDRSERATGRKTASSPRIA